MNRIHRRTFLRRAAAGTAAALGLSGCADKLPPVFPVTGTVVLKGKGDVRRLKDMTLQFQSLTDPEEMPGATIQADGSFTLYCMRGTKVVPGVKEGKYRARIMISTNDYNPDHPPTKLIPQRYLSFKTSPLEYAVTPAENHITVEIETDGGR
jgi:hypothetical protein